MMKRVCFALAISAQPVVADQALVDHALDAHILPVFDNLAIQTETLEQVAEIHCEPKMAELRSAYSDAFDAWVRASHIRTGPSEEDERAFALAFWPDTKGFTGKALNRLISKQDPIVFDPVEFATLSVAGRGFYAMEF